MPPVGSPLPLTPGLLLFLFIFLVAISMSHFNLPFQHPQSEASLGLNHFLSKMGTLMLVLPVLQLLPSRAAFPSSGFVSLP